jgi:Zn-dependent metalloprotease
MPGVDPEEIVRGFLSADPSLHGLSFSQADDLVTEANYTNPAGNLHWVTLKQHVNGIPVFRGEVRASITPNNEIASMVSELATGVGPFSIGTPTMSPEDAIRLAADNIGVRLTVVPPLIERSVDGLKYKFDRGPFADDITVELVVFPLGPGKGS